MNPNTRVTKMGNNALKMLSIMGQKVGLHIIGFAPPGGGGRILCVLIVTATV
jgi:hypothetical protein